MTRPRRLRMRLVAAALPVLFLFLRLLPWRAVLAAGWLLGAVAAPLQPRRRRRAGDGLRRALGNRLDRPQTDAIIHRVFRGLGMNLAEICWVAARPQRADARVRFEGLEHLQAARAGGRGAVLITGHLGSWELMAASIVRSGIPLSVIARAANDGRVNQFLVGLRSRLRVRTVLRGSTAAAREILRTLRSGEVLGCLIDQDTRVDGIFVDFFGRPAFTPTGPIVLALRAGAPIVLGCTWREADGTHRIRFDPPLRIEPSGDRDVDVRRTTEACTRWLEQRIRERPEQWVWIHRRWRRQPTADAAAAVD